MAATEVFANDCAGTVITGGTTAPAAGTVETWTVNITTPFPGAQTGVTQFHVCDLPPLNLEKFLVTNGSGAIGVQTWTVTRGVEGSTPVAHAPGFTIRQVVTAGWLGPLSGALTPIAASGDTSGTTDAANLSAAVNAAQSSGARFVDLGPGNFYVSTGQVSAQLTNYPVFIRGAGEGVTTIYAIGSGDCLRMRNPNAPAGGFTSLTVYGGGVLDLTIDGSLASTGAVGLHIGDGEHYQVRCQIQHFNKTGSVGLWIDNSVWWTEKGHWECVFVDNTLCVKQSLTTGSNNSNAENFFYWTFFLSANQSAISMQGISHYLGALTCRGVFNAGGVSNSAVFLTMDATSSINNCFVDVSVNLGQSGAAAQTNNWASGATFQSNFGRMVFGGAAGWTPGFYGASGNTWASNVTGYSFAGDILGDTNIHPATSQSTAPPQPSMFLAGNPMVFAQAFARASDGKINDFCGDFFDFGVLSANITVGLGASGSRGSCPGPQRKTLRFQQAASGGPYTLTWPHNASPTTSAPKVVWAGGTAPTMSTGANAVDLYSLETFDGATWYGRAIQNVS